MDLGKAKAVPQAGLTFDRAAAALRKNKDGKEFYLGLSAVGRKSNRETKFYRRRKRWLA